MNNIIKLEATGKEIKLGNNDKYENVIYGIQNLDNGKMYIGATNNFKRRSKEQGTKKSGIVKKYGIENFSIFIIDSADDYNDLSHMEIYYIAAYNTIENGYNKTNGGEGGIPLNFNDSQKDDIISKYLNDSLSTREIAKIYNCNHKTICRILKELNIECRNGRTPKIEFSDKDVRNIVDMRNSGNTLAEIASAYECSINPIRKVLAKNEDKLSEVNL